MIANIEAKDSMRDFSNRTEWTAKPGHSSVADGVAPKRPDMLRLEIAS